MKKIMMGVLAALALTSCVSVSKLNDAITAHYAPHRGLAAPTQFSLKPLNTGGKLAETKKTKSVAIPALFYWQFGRTFHTDLNPLVPHHLFSKYAEGHAQKIKLDQKLAGKSIRLELLQASNAVESKYTSITIFAVFVGATTWRNEASIIAKPLEVAYEVRNQDGAVANAGVITITEDDLMPYASQYQLSGKAQVAGKDFTETFLKAYDNYIYLQSKVFVSKLAEKI